MNEQALQAAEQPAQLVSMPTWIASRYSPADAPCLNTVRRWVRENRIQPAPQKQGRAYFFHPAAHYCAGVPAK